MHFRIVTFSKFWLFLCILTPLGIPTYLKILTVLGILIFLLNCLFGNSEHFFFKGLKFGGFLNFYFFLFWPFGSCLCILYFLFFDLNTFIKVRDESTLSTWGDESISWTYRRLTYRKAVLINEERISCWIR